MISEFHRRRLLQVYPQLERAVEPMRLASNERSRFKLDGVYCNYFWEEHYRDFQLREANDPSLVITVKASGYCLNPLRSDGDVMHFDPTVPAKHGDVVLFQHPDGAVPHLFMSKMLVEFGGEYWLAWREAMFPLGDTRILGVEVAYAPAESSSLANRISQGASS